MFLVCLVWDVALLFPIERVWEEQHIQSHSCRAAFLATPTDHTFIRGQVFLLSPRLQCDFTTEMAHPNQPPNDEANPERQGSIAPTSPS